MGAVDWDLGVGGGVVGGACCYCGWGGWGLGREGVADGWRERYLPRGICLVLWGLWFWACWEERFSGLGAQVMKSLVT